MFEQYDGWEEEEEVASEGGAGTVSPLFKLPQKTSSAATILLFHDRGYQPQCISDEPKTVDNLGFVTLLSRKKSLCHGGFSFCYLSDTHHYCYFMILLCVVDHEG